MLTDDRSARALAGVKAGKTPAFLCLGIPDPLLKPMTKQEQHIPSSVQNPGKIALAMSIFAQAALGDHRDGAGVNKPTTYGLAFDASSVLA